MSGERLFSSSLVRFSGGAPPADLSPWLFWRAAPAPRRSVVAPQWLAEILCKSGEHDIEADADSLLHARIRVDGMWHVGRKDEQRPILHSQNHLVGIAGREGHHRRPNDAGLAPRVMEVDGVRTRVGTEVVDATQIVVRMMVHSMRGSRCQDRGPACTDFEGVVADLEE